MARESRDVWVKRVERWRESGLSPAEFAAEVGINAGSLRHWGWRVNAERRREAAKGMSFVEVAAPILDTAPTRAAADAAPERLELVSAERRGRASSGWVRAGGAAPAARGRGLMLPASVRILVCTAPQDMRRSFDALALAASQLLGQDPRSGALFVFVNKRSTRAKVPWWDTNGYCLLYKRLHQAVFVVPSARLSDSLGVRIDAEALATLLAGIEKRRRGLDG